MSKESLDDLRYELELKNAEIDELNMGADQQAETLFHQIKIREKEFGG